MAKITKPKIAPQGGAALLARYAAPSAWALAAVVVCWLLAFELRDPSWYATGLFFFTAALWLFISRLSKERMGLVWGDLQNYAIALAYPIVICLAVLAIMLLANEQVTIPSHDQLYSFIGMFVVFIILNILTTGLFFRGWLFGMMQERKIGAKEIVIFTSFAYCVWHIPLFFIDPDYEVSANLMPIFLSGVFLDGMVWGLLRMRSGSIGPGAVGHALWDALTFGIFGFGIHPMLISIPQVEVFGLQRGWVSVALRLLFVCALWLWFFCPKPTPAKKSR